MANYSTYTNSELQEEMGKLEAQYKTVQEESVELADEIDTIKRVISDKMAILKEKFITLEDINKSFIDAKTIYDKRNGKAKAQNK